MVDVAQPMAPGPYDQERGAGARALTEVAPVSLASSHEPGIFKHALTFLGVDTEPPNREIASLMK